METKSFTSSQVKSGKYFENTKDLFIVFNTGSIYLYQDVPLDKWEGLKSAESAGKYLNANIKGKYIHKLISNKTESNN